MTEGTETLSLNLSFDELMQAAAIAGYVVGEDQFHGHGESCVHDAPLNAFVGVMAMIGIRKAIAESYERRFPYRADDDLDAWLWREGYHALPLSEHPGGADHE